MHYLSAPPPPSSRALEFAKSELHIPTELIVRELRGEYSLLACSLLIHAAYDELNSLERSVKSARTYLMVLDWALCIMRNGHPTQCQDDGMYSGYLAARLLFGWICGVQKSRSISDWNNSLPRRLAPFARSVEPTLLINGLLEHLFEDNYFIALFSHWQDDRYLKDIYLRALEWRKGWEEQGIVFGGTL